MNIEKDDRVVEGIHGFSSASSWVKPESELILDRLEWFKDQKLALMVHWGVYSQLGITESWPLSDEDASWSRKDIDWVSGSSELRRQYRSLLESFNPLRFMPGQWADSASLNGFRYFIFTCKHHDGFCLWDSSQTSFKSTARNCPFSRNPLADICKSLFDALRERGLGIGAYFSKPDWSSPYYWKEGWLHTPKGRNPDYDVKLHPGVWKKFVEFTHAQVLELISKYGAIDILWLDGGWVRPENGQDIQMDELISKARRFQPGLLAVDRTVGGPHENYITPEQKIPPAALDAPWESCITMGTKFSFKYEDDYKSPRELVHLLIKTISRGGNLALNVGAQPDGRLPGAAVKRMECIGRWLEMYGEAVYGTRAVEPFEKNGVYFTSKNGSIYAFILFEAEDERVEASAVIPCDFRIESIDLLGHRKKLRFRQEHERIEAEIPPVFSAKKSPYAIAFKITKKEL